MRIVGLSFFVLALWVCVLTYFSEQRALAQPRED